jgi:hypothetical protein
VCGTPLCRFDIIRYSYGKPYCTSCYGKIINGRKNAEKRSNK